MEIVKTPATDKSTGRYRAKRDFARTPEPAPHDAAVRSGPPIFVVQKHDASRLHYDFRLEHDGVLWSWAIPKGPSLDPKDKRLAVHVEDHPRDYADFEGSIPKGEYGGGTVEIWDRGIWTPLGDPAADLARGEMKFELAGERLHGKFVFIRLKPRAKDHNENWLLIKEHDEHERPGGDVAAMEGEPRRVEQSPAKRPLRSPPQASPRTKPAAPAGAPRSHIGAECAIPGDLPATQAPQLASFTDSPPDEQGWISEIKFDGYRLLVFKQGDTVRLTTRNGLDWTARLPSIAALIRQTAPHSMLLDCELVALRPDGLSSFADLQAALSAGRDGDLVLFAFDLLHLDGNDLRPCRLEVRKAEMESLHIWNDRLRFSDHIEGDAGPVRRQACSMGLEGIIAKRASAPYRPGRGSDWLKLKCAGREEFVVLGWTPPSRSRVGIGALELGFYDGDGALHYAGGVGTGFTDGELRALRIHLDEIATESPPELLTSGEKVDRKIVWVRPELVAEVQFTGWSGAGRLRHAVYLGLREDKTAAEVVRPLPDPDVPRAPLHPSHSGMLVTAPAPQKSAPQKSAAQKQAPQKSAPPQRPVLQRSVPPTAASASRLTHPNKELWPGVTKQNLADYWTTVAEAALPGIAHRPLALVRCPDGTDGQHFFQKHAMRGMSPALREGECDGAPYLEFADAAGLQACAQMAAIELHTWGSAAADPGHADRLVFDLDPGEGVDWPTIVNAALDVRDRLAAEGLTPFCRTSGGKGLHVVAPLAPGADWDTVRAWCRAFAEAMERDSPDRYVATVPKARRNGRILVDWLRNGLGSTAIASFSPRARPGATVATPLAWREVSERLDPASFTVASVPRRLARQKRDPWEGFAAAAQPLPAAKTPPKRRTAGGKP
jgi:bifunctional non-homologous end joining protein LigD